MDGRILKGILYVFFGKRKAETLTNSISFVTLIFVTFLASLGVFYMKNISIFLITIFLWIFYLEQDRIYKKRNKIYNLIDKTIEINANK